MSHQIATSKLVSIIVPVYNVELYIADCIKSIIGQTYRNLEVILVNDGSTDSSGKILDDFGSKDERIRVVHKKNGGVSSARNAGLDSATGDFIVFIDSDDWIDKKMIEKMVSTAVSNDIDVVACGMQYVNMDGVPREIAYGYHPLSQVLSAKEAYYEVVKELVHGGGSLCCRLISRQLTLEKRFIEGMRVSEDQEWLLRVVKDVKFMMYIPDFFYSIRVRADSATTRSNKSDIKDIEIVNQAILAWARDNNMLEDGVILNALFVRSRLQYSSAMRSLCDASEQSALRKKMIIAYRKSTELSRDERLKYYISLLPSNLYRSTRQLLKRVKKESN